MGLLELLLILVLRRRRRRRLHERRMLGQLVAVVEVGLCTHVHTFQCQISGGFGADGRDCRIVWFKFDSRRLAKSVCASVCLFGGRSGRLFGPVPGGRKYILDTCAGLLNNNLI